MKDKLPALEKDAQALTAREPPPSTATAASRWPRTLPTPTFQHHAPKLIVAGKPITFALQVWPLTHVTKVRLNYRALNQLAPWKSVEATASHAVFTVAGDEIDARWDLQYYFEILNTEATGWFWPDSRHGAPNHVMTVQVLP